ncbi:unnamed protein product [Ceutorhynchus assimilis]|uniref:Uncharacterized protein n=1 Tax=Ceutorhynchus assimilis TaxID=467358 RepID=A0A9N9MET9_9CUCU|nr:unnamed protein product [Ceutorhynchus assimilis]
MSKVIVVLVRTFHFHQPYNMPKKPKARLPQNSHLEIQSSKPKGIISKNNLGEISIQLYAKPGAKQNAITGKLELNATDIENIIGIHQTKNANPVNINTDKLDNGRNVKKQNTDPIDETILNFNTPYTEIFTPKKFIKRTPPKDLKHDGDNSTSPKRTRSGSSSSSFSDRPKIPRHSDKPTEETETEIENQTEITQAKVINFEDTNNMKESILNALSSLNNLTEKEDFTQKDKSELRKAGFKLHEIVTKLAYKVGKRENENSALNKKMQKKNHNAPALSRIGRHPIVKENQGQGVEKSKR